jgi:hypothetical protein
MTWERKKLLIWGKTYPEFSKTYYETVCTGAIDAETGKLIRIYPLTLRYMKDPFKLYDWIEAEIERNTSDFRPESYKIKQDTITKVGSIDIQKKPKEGWAERSKWVLAPGNVQPSVAALQQAEAGDHTSLGLVRPRKITGVYVRKKSDADRVEWEEHRKRALAQKDLFVDVDAETATKDLRFMPVQYRLCFVCDDNTCTCQNNPHDFGIFDWGVYALSRRVFAEKGGPGAERDVIAKIEQALDFTKRDGHLFLGNSKAHSHSFTVVGLFTPPIVKEAERPKRDSQMEISF